MSGSDIAAGALLGAAGGIIGVLLLRQLFPTVFTTQIAAPIRKPLQGTGLDTFAQNNDEVNPTGPFLQ